MKAKDFVREHYDDIEFSDCKVIHYHYDTTIALHFDFYDDVFNMYHDVDKTTEYLTKKALEEQLEEDIELEILLTTPTLVRDYNTTIYKSGGELHYA